MLISISATTGPMYRPFVDAVLALQWPERLVYLWQVGGDNAPTKGLNIQAKYEYARRVMLDLGFDALLTVDHDTIVPPDALLKLAGVEADVIYGLYTWRGQYPGWNATIELSKSVKRSLSWDKEEAKAAWGKPVRVKGMGHGCTLFRRAVLEAIEFIEPLDMEYHCDWTFAIEAERLGFVQMCHTGVVCGHILKERGDVVSWPDIEGHRLYHWAKLVDSPAGPLTDAEAYARNARAETVNGSPRY